jgi:hypothetical protein
MCTPVENTYKLRFGVLMASSMKMTAFWDMASYSVVEAN